MIHSSLSIVLPVFNGEMTIDRCLRSIYDQSFRDYELIVIDDCSEDSTFSRLKLILPTLFCNYKLIRNDFNLGLTKTLIKAIDLSTGDIIARIDADDCWHPDKLKKQMEIMSSCDSLVLLGTSTTSNLQDLCSVNTMEPCLSSNALRTELRFRNPICHSSVLFRRSSYFMVGGYCSLFRYSQDYLLWILFAHVGDLRVLPQCLTFSESSLNTNRITSLVPNKQRGFAMLAKLIYCYLFGFRLTSLVSLFKDILFCIIPIKSRIS